MDSGEQTLILVDSTDRFLGYAPRSRCHQGDGLLHRAIALLVLDGAGRLLLQERRHHLFDRLWDITGATHPLHRAEGDESYAEAGRRCLRVEWGFETPLRLAGSFVYFAREGERCEHEYCALLIGRWTGPVKANPEHAYSCRFVRLEECRAELRQDPTRFTPWARLALDVWDGRESSAS